MTGDATVGIGRVGVSLAVAVLIVSGCSTAASGPGASVSAHGSVASSSASSSPVPSYLKLLGGCGVALPASWQQALTAGRLAHGPGESLIVQSVSGRPDAVAVSRAAPDWSGLELVRLDGSVRRVHAFDDPDSDQILGVASDGRYWVWSQTHSVYNWDDWTLWSFDAVTGRVRQLARSTFTANGEPVPGPFLFPAAQDGQAAWSRGNPDGTSTLYLTDLATGRSRVAATGHPSTPLFAHHLLVWPESPAPGALSQLRAADPTTLRPVELPAALRQVRGPNWLTADGDRLVWASADYTQLYTWTWANPTDPPRRLLDVGPAEHIGQPHATGDLIAWAGDHAMFAYDLRSDAVTQLTAEYGGVAVAGTLLAVSEQETTVKSTHPVLSVTLVDTTHLPPLPGC